MKFAHISDLHIGKKVNNYSMLEDQEYILNEILKIIEKEAVDGVLIAGDIYDKAIPSAEAVSLFDDFLVKLAAGKRQIFIISGNHDSPERIAFGGRLLKNSGVHVSPVYKGILEEVTLKDEYGEIKVYLLPFIKPVHIKHYYPKEVIEDYSGAVACALKQAKPDWSKRNVLVAHQYVTGAVRCESEEITVGGLDNVSGEVFEGFDYVALGHLHGGQNIGGQKDGEETDGAIIRYSGTPLKYSFSEVHHKKSVTIVELKEKGNVKIRMVPLHPLRDFIMLRGCYEELISRDFTKQIEVNAYVHITLLDEEDVPNAFSNLVKVYPNLMQLKYDNKRTREQRNLPQWEESRMQNPLSLFDDFYESMNNEPLSQIQREYLEKKMEEIWENS